MTSSNFSLLFHYQKYLIDLEHPNLSRKLKADHESPAAVTDALHQRFADDVANFIHDPVLQNNCDILNFINIENGKVLDQENAVVVRYDSNVRRIGNSAEVD